MTPGARKTGTGLTVRCQVHFRQSAHGRKRLAQGDPPLSPPIESGRVPRVARLMALAIHLDRLIREGAVRDYADLARLGHVTRARVTQIMNLLALAPDLQEGVLFLPRTVSGRDLISERHLRRIAAEPDWRKQRRLWRTRSKALFRKGGPKTRPPSPGVWDCRGPASRSSPACAGWPPPSRNPSWLTRTQCTRL